MASLDDKAVSITLTRHFNEDDQKVEYSYHSQNQGGTIHDDKITFSSIAWLIVELMSRITYLVVEYLEEAHPVQDVIGKGDLTNE